MALSRMNGDATVPPSVVPAPEAAPVAAASAPSQIGPAIDSRALLQGSKAVTICHNGEIYRLQATRQGKLILTK